MTATSAARLAVFVPSLRGGGAERVMLTLAGSFSRRGYAVDLLLPQATGPYLGQVAGGVRVVDLGVRRVLASLPRLVEYLRRQRPAALLSTLSHANMVALWARRIARAPTRVIVRESNTLSVNARFAPRRRQRIIPLLARHYYPWADAVVAVSDGVAEDLVREVGVPRERVCVLPNPVITPELLALAKVPLPHPWFVPGAPPVVLGVGRLARQKDFGLLIHAFARVRRARPCRLVVLGEGSERAALERLAVERGVAADVQLPGFVDNPFQYMARAAVFVLSSAWEGMPAVLIQAMACGAPVVATDCPSGPRELLDGGRHGALVPPGDPDRLATAILRAIEHPVRAPYEAFARFTSEAAAAHYLAVLGVEPGAHE